jgi:hypothetical protein
MEFKVHIEMQTKSNIKVLHSIYGVLIVDKPPMMKIHPNSMRFNPILMIILVKLTMTQMMWKV